MTDHIAAERTTIERPLASDRRVAIVGLVVIPGFPGPGCSPAPALNEPDRDDQFGVPAAPRPATAIEWNGAYWLVMLAMWRVMMIAMMTPSAPVAVIAHV